MIKKLFYLFILGIALLTSCNQGMKSGGIVGQEDEDHGAKVLEAIQTTSYTYLRVEKDKQEEWIAIDRADIPVGTVLYFEEGLEMNNFESPELGRTFEKVYFVQNISDKPLDAQEDPHAAVMGDQPQKPVLTKEELTIQQPEDGTSIATIYVTKNELSGKQVKVKGQVTKVNAGIMGRNWVHIQDGTADGNNFDLTVTTDHLPEVGDVITYSGILATDKDFGAGYSYAVILEDAEPVIQR